MKVLLLCTSIEGGGAAHASLALLYALRQEGIEARMLTLFPSKNIHTPYIDSVCKGLLGRAKANAYKLLERIDIMRANGFKKDFLCRFSSATVAAPAWTHPWIEWADIIHFHWVNHGLLSLSAITHLTQGNKPIVWTLHDLWAVTGGCHLPFLFEETGVSVCPEYSLGCNSCHLLQGSSSKKAYYSRILFERKQAFNQGNITYITVSRREQELLMKSKLLANSAVRVQTIPPPTLPAEQDNHQSSMSQPLWYSPDVSYLLLVASRIDDEVKGPKLLLQSMQYLKQLLEEVHTEDRVELILVGELVDKSLLNDIAIPTHYIGRKNGIELQDLYRLASVTLSTSIFETFGLTLVESLNQGTPVLAFKSYGPEDIIQNGGNGYLVSDYNPKEMAQAVLRILDDVRDGLIDENTCKRSAEPFSLDIIAKRHIDLYKSFL